MKTIIVSLLAIASLSLTINARAQGGGYDPSLPMAPSLPTYGPERGSGESRVSRTSYQGAGHHMHDRPGHTETRYDTIKTVSQSHVGPRIFRQPRYTGPESLRGLTRKHSSEIPSFLFLNDMNNGGVELDQAKDAWFWCIRIAGMWIPLYIEHCILDGHDYFNRVKLTNVPCPDRKVRKTTVVHQPPPCRPCEERRRLAMNQSRQHGSLLQPVVGALLQVALSGSHHQVPTPRRMPPKRRPPPLRFD